MLIGLTIRDVILAERLDLAFGPGLTALTGETGAGKSIILGALNLALGARGDAGLVRRGADQASAAVIFAPGADHPVWDRLEEKGLAGRRDEDLMLRRLLTADGRSRAFINDQPTSLGVLREVAELLVQTHGQHETVGLLDARTHRPLLDAFAGLDDALRTCAAAWNAWRQAQSALAEAEAATARAESEREELADRLTELDRLAPRDGEEAELASRRAMLAGAERAIADISAARDTLDPDALSARLGQAFRVLGRARERVLAAGVATEDPVAASLEAAAAAIDRTLIEAAEAAAAIDAAAELFDVEPGELEVAESRLFTLRGIARRLGVTVDDLAAVRIATIDRLAAIDVAGESMAEARAAAAAARDAYAAAAEVLSRGRRSAGERLGKAVGAELEPLRLGKTRFQVAVEVLPEARQGPSGRDRVEFEIATLAAAPFAPLGSIASGGELARLALAIEASLNLRGTWPPLMIFDEVDQGVGGAVADAVGQRLARLARETQVVVVTHSPQVAARADSQWRVTRSGSGEAERTTVETLAPAAREEEIARMLSGETVTEAARAAARALMAA